MGIRKVGSDANVAYKTLFEIEGRDKTNELLEVAKKFKINDRVNIQVTDNDRGGHKPLRVITGTIIAKNEKFITLQKDNYKESISFIDFYIGKAVVIC